MAGHGPTRTSTCHLHAPRLKNADVVVPTHARCHPHTRAPEATVLLAVPAVRLQQLQHKHSCSQRAARREHAVGAVAREHGRLADQRRRTHPHALRGTGQLRTHRHSGRERSVANQHTTGNAARAREGRGLRLTWRGVGSGLRSGKGMPGTYAVNGSGGSSRGRRQWERSLSGWST